MLMLMYHIEQPLTARGGNTFRYSDTSTMTYADKSDSLGCQVGTKGARHQRNLAMQKQNMSKV